MTQIILYQQVQFVQFIIFFLLQKDAGDYGEVIGDMLCLAVFLQADNQGIMWDFRKIEPKNQKLNLNRNKN